MKYIRSFEIKGMQFELIDCGNRRLRLLNTEPGCHWAEYIGAGTWIAVRDGHRRMTFGSAYTPLSPEQVAVRLLAFDEMQGLRNREAAQ